jgi:hypothetical protein
MHFVTHTHILSKRKRLFTSFAISPNITTFTLAPAARAKPFAHSRACTHPAQLTEASVLSTPSHGPHYRKPNKHSLNHDPAYPDGNPISRILATSAHVDLQQYGISPCAPNIGETGPSPHAWTQMTHYANSSDRPRQLLTRHGTCEPASTTWDIGEDREGV